MWWRRYVPLPQDEEASQGPQQPSTALIQPYKSNRLWLVVLASVSLAIGIGLLCLPNRPAPEIRPAQTMANDVIGLAADGWLSFRWNTPPLAPRLTSHNIPATAAQKATSPSCRDLWISRGEVCPELRPTAKTGSASMHHLVAFDAVYTWQNGSDARAQAAKSDYANADASHKSGLAPRHFRNHDELRHSLRGLFKAFSGSNALKKAYIYTTDLPEDGHLRIGLVPQWLDSSRLKSNDTEIHPLFPWQTYRSSAFKTMQDAQRWRDGALPTFQSQSVESQMTFIPNISDTWIYLCDDFFVANYLNPSDIFSPLFGPMFRLQRNLLVNGAPKDSSQANLEGEWRSLGYAAWLINERFGSIGRPYPLHTIKTYNSALLRELEAIWADELADTASIRFRGRGTEANMAFLFIHFVIERHREALLWSFIVGKSDANADGQLDMNELAKMRISVSAPRSTDSASCPVRRPLRPGQDDWHAAMLSAGLDTPKQSSTFWSSSNGYAFLSDNSASKWGDGDWPDFSKNTPEDQPFCELSPQCLSLLDTPVTSSDLFKKMAFEDRECGNCIMVALLNTTGFEAFLPPKTRTSSTNVSNATVVLPLTKTWQSADYSLAHVLPSSLNLRDFATSLIQRYSYTVGDTPFRMVQLRAGRMTRLQLAPLKTFDEADAASPVLLAIQDDLFNGFEQANESLEAWFQARFPDKGFYEL